MKKLIKKWAEKLSDFKLLARVMMCLSAVAAVVAILGFVAFQFSRGVDEATKSSLAAFGVPGEKRELIGMGFFFVLTIVLVLAIVIIYQAKSYAFPKTKMSPNKTLPVLNVVNGIVCFVAAIFCVLAVVLDTPVEGNTTSPNVGPTVIAWAWYGLCALFVCSGLVNLCMLLPVTKSRYYMPSLNEEKK